jgi:RNA polymerase sigma-70 factor (ECF subfamily)
MRGARRALRPSMDDAEMVRAWLAGDRGAGDAFLARIRPDLVALCERILGNAADAEDAAQEALANLARSRDRLGEVRDLRGWIATLGTNCALNLKKRRDRSRPTALDELPEPPAEAAPADDASPEAMQRALGSLPERYRLALELRYRRGLSLAEVAKRLGVSEGNARVILHRAIGHARSRVKGT